MDRSDPRVARGNHDGAARILTAIIFGDSAEAKVYDMTMDSLARENEAILAELDQLDEASRDFLGSFDLQQGVLDERGMQLFAQMEHRIDALIEGPSDRAALPAPPTRLQIDTPQQAGESVAQRDPFARVFKKS